MPRNGRPASADPLHPVDLRGLNLIGFKSSGSTQRVIDQLRADGVEPHFVLRSDDNNVVQGFVTAGFGAALIPRLAAELLSGSFEVTSIILVICPLNPFELKSASRDCTIPDTWVRSAVELLPNWLSRT